ncbi:hypothetical protein C8P66_102127 [Humitalea rosea]|uniref:Uncharacterized protein n=1 Tax=Humitalea rosea TaxID=990373 RepID=A0A2W7IT61_9PROT|nr:hypothetical protein [Humitalea rosea]PZW50439.1 hypothetical protein C8P66_102127 [Humitalea rosea]
MSENLITAELDPAPAIPQKFLDPATGSVRVDALLKSYLELERRLSQRMAPPATDATAEEITRFRAAMGIPEAPDGYEITAPCPECSPDAAVNAKLHAAGFTPEQAQLVYDLAAEKLLPAIAEAAAEYEATRQRDKLIAHFGGEDRFRAIAGQLATWGRANLPPAVFEAMSGTAEGVIALAGMMDRREPALGRNADAPGPMDEAGLRKMMRDPRYWQKRDPEFVSRVTEGFRRLVGG